MQDVLHLALNIVFLVGLVSLLSWLSAQPRLRRTTGRSQKRATSRGASRAGRQTLPTEQAWECFSCGRAGLRFTGCDQTTCLMRQLISESPTLSGVFTGAGQPGPAHPTEAWTRCAARPCAEMKVCCWLECAATIDTAADEVTR